MKRRWRIAILIAFCICGFGCGAEKEEKMTEITLLHGWGTTEKDNQVMRQIYQDFEKENPDVRLNMISMPSLEGVIEKARDMLAVGKVPDLIFTGGKGRDDLYSFMVHNGYALNLMPYIQEDQELMDSISPVIFERWTNEKGELYTVSDVLLVSGYWYNEEIFRNAGIRKEPATWEEFLDCCQKIGQWAEKEKLSTVPIHLDPETCLYLLDAIMDPEKDAQGNGEDQNLAEALQTLQKIGLLASVEDENYSFRDKVRSFNIGHSAICVNGVWGEQMLHSNLKAGYALFPSEDGKGVGMLSACTGYLVGNSGDEKKKQACIRFLKYMLSETVQKRILMETGQVPSNPKVDLKEVYGERPDLYRAYQVVMGADTFREIPVNRWSSAWIAEYDTNIEGFLEGELSLEKFLDKLNKVNK